MVARFWRWMIFIGLVGAVVFPAAAQDGTRLIELNVDAAYDGAYRPDQWMPIRFTVENRGDELNARVIIRPETNRGVTGTFSLPVALPTNSRKTDTLYITAQAGVQTLTVEVLDAENSRLAEDTVPLRTLQTSDGLFIVLTTAASGALDLQSAAPEGMSAAQATWTVNLLPDHPSGLESVNTILFTDVDSGTLTPAQRDAISAWVLDGGHLIVTGGISWQATAAGLSDLLPLLPTAQQTISDLTPLATFSGQNAPLTGDTTLATGELQADARVLVALADGTPLLLRRTLGEGTVDYLAVDPNTVPLRGWDGMDQLWFGLMSSLAPQPNWSHGVIRWENAAAATQIMPGLDVLPSILPICGFLALYIALIGPVNYIVLNRINRREYAWLTIPVLIAIFSGLAYVVGGQLRGNDPSVARLTMIRSWPNTDIAHSTQLVGVLSPQRGQYTLAAPTDHFLRGVPRGLLGNANNNMLVSSFQSSIDVQQDRGFRAVDFPLDASFVGAFFASGTTPAPNISGSATLFYGPGSNDRHSVRGAVRNGSDQTLTNAVILGRGAVLRFAQDIPPGELVEFDMVLDPLEPPAPAPMGYPTERGSTAFGSSPYGYGGTTVFERTARDLLGDIPYIADPSYFYNTGERESTADQEERRRQLFVTTLVEDLFISTGRGNSIYFVGWGTDSPLELQIDDDRRFKAFDSTLYIVALDTALQPATDRVRITADQFVWAVAGRKGVRFASYAPVNLNLSSGNSIAFRYTPLAESQLGEVTELRIVARYMSGGATPVPVNVWDWEGEQWVGQTVLNGELRLTQPSRYIGPQNAVQLQVIGDDNNYFDLEHLYIEQVGRFAASE